jgi:hypothetical protein
VVWPFQCPELGAIIPSGGSASNALGDFTQLKGVAIMVGIEARVTVMRTLLAFLVMLCSLDFALTSANAACLDVKQTTTSFEGTLSYSIFAGPPNYQDVRKGDTPEPTYILKLDAPICVTGDEFLNPNDRFDKIQVYPADSGTAGRFLSRDLRRLVGKRVTVEGSSAFGAHTGHHHASLLLPITNIAVPFDLAKGSGTAMTTVQAFYMALGAADGNEASKFVVPEKRSSGAFSSSAITNFYSKLIVPLTLIDVRAVSSDEYRVRYSYVASGSGRCNGDALVRTIKRDGLNLIDSIKATGDC